MTVLKTKPLHCKRLRLRVDLVAVLLRLKETLYLSERVHGTL